MRYYCTSSMLGIYMCLILSFSQYYVPFVNSQKCENPQAITGTFGTASEPVDTDTGAKKFIYSLKGPVDLVVIIERINRRVFYLRERPIIENILRYHAIINQDNVRLEIITHGDTEYAIPVRGITDTSIDKCQLFATYWDDVRYNGNPSNNDAISDAFSKAIDVFQKGQNDRDGSKGILLVFTNGDYSNSTWDSLQQSKDSLQAMDVDIYTVSSGLADQIDVETVKSLAKGEDYYGSDSDWMDDLLTTLPLMGYDDLGNSSYTITDGEPCPENSTKMCNNYDGYSQCICDDSPATDGCTVLPDYQASRVDDDCFNSMCENNGGCVDGTDDYICWCPLGYNGRYCENNIDECSMSHTCENDGICSDAVNDYTCQCIKGCGCDCELTCDDDEDDDGLSLWMILGMAIGAFVVIIIIGSTCIIVTHNRETQTNRERENGIATLHSVDTTSTVITDGPAPPLPQRQNSDTVNMPFKSERRPSAQERRPSTPELPPVIPDRRPSSPGILPLPDRRPSSPGIEPLPPKPTTLPRIDTSLARRPLPPIPEPPQSRPDIVRDQPIVESGSDLRAYQNMPVESGMASWMDYVCEVMEDHSLDRLCISHVERTTWIASAAEFLLNKDEIDYFMNIFTENHIGIQLKLKNKWFTLEENDGQIIICEDQEKTERVIVGRTRHHIVVGAASLDNPQGNDISRVEVEWIRHTIEGQGG